MLVHLGSGGDDAWYGRGRAQPVPYHTTHHHHHFPGAPTYREVEMFSRTKLFMPATENGRAQPRTALPLWFQLLAGILFLLAIVLRVSLYHIQTSDYTVFVSQWYDYIQNHGGFAALRYSFSNYNVPYLYLLTIATYLPVPKLIAIKSISVLFDVVLGIFTYLIINLKYPRSIAAVIGALVILFAPTIFINSAAWGQCDAIYTAFCLGSLYFLLKERPAWACVFFALAFSFKLQAIFFLPVLLIIAISAGTDLSRLVKRIVGGRGHDKSVPAVAGDGHDQAVPAMIGEGHDQLVPAVVGDGH